MSRGVPMIREGGRRGFFGDLGVGDGDGESLGPEKARQLETARSGRRRGGTRLQRLRAFDWRSGLQDPLFTPVRCHCNCASAVALTRFLSLVESLQLFKLEHRNNPIFGLNCRIAKARIAPPTTNRPSNRAQHCNIALKAHFSTPWPLTGASRIDPASMPVAHGR